LAFIVFVFPLHFRIGLLICTQKQNVRKADERDCVGSRSVWEELTSWPGPVAQVIGGLPSKHKAQSSNPSTDKTKQTKKQKKNPNKQTKKTRNDVNI
jgi:hypothetical protein